MTSFLFSTDCILLNSKISKDFFVFLRSVFWCERFFLMNHFIQKYLLVILFQPKYEVFPIFGYQLHLWPLKSNGNFWMLSSSSYFSAHLSPNIANYLTMIFDVSCFGPIYRRKDLCRKQSLFHIKVYFYFLNYPFLIFLQGWKNLFGLLILIYCP